MNCPNCGALLREGVAFCTQCGTACSAVSFGETPTQQTSAQQNFQQQNSQQQNSQQQNSQQQNSQQQNFQQGYSQQSYAQPVVETMTQAKPRGKKSGGRVWAKIVSVLLSILLTVSLLATALVLDLRTLTNPDRLAQTLEVVMTPASVTVRLLAADGSTQQVDISLDASTEELLDLVYESLEETYGDELEMTREQLQRFYEKSTLRQRVSGLVAGYVSDLVNGTEETEITEEYILDVIGENKKLIESTFHVPVDDKMIRDVLQFVEVEELNDAIREDLMEEISATDLGGMTMEDFFQTLRGYAANSTLWILIGVNVLLIAVLLLVNWGRIASGLRCVAIPMVIDGVLLALPTTVVLVLMQGNALVSVLVRTLFSSMALVHYGMLVVGIVLLAVSIVLGVVMRKKR